MQWHDLFYVFAFIPCIAITIYVRRLWRITYGTRTRAYTRIQPIPPLPPELADIDSELRALDFRYALATESVMSVAAQPVREWTYVSPDQRIYAEVSYLPAQALPFIGFISWFADDAAIMTTQPFGEYIITHPRLHFRYARYSLKTAFEHHAAQIESWQVQHGEAVRFVTAEQLVEYSPRFNRLYKSTYNRRGMRLALANIACFVVIAGLFLLVPTAVSDIIYQRAGTLPAIILFSLVLVMIVIRQIVDQRLSYPGPPVDEPPLNT